MVSALVPVQSNTAPHLLTRVIERALAPEDTLRAERDELKRTLESHRRMFGLWTDLPLEQADIYERRIADLDAQLSGISAVKHALKLGYQPYTPPADWFVGSAPATFLRQNKDQVRSQLELVFNTPIPEPALQQWKIARETGLFAIYAIAAPDRSLFTDSIQRVQSVFADPFLIGYIRTDSEPSIRSTRDRWIGIAPGVITEGLFGFMIAFWDLQKDLEFALNREVPRG